MVLRHRKISGIFYLSILIITVLSSNALAQRSTNVSKLLEFARLSKEQFTREKAEAEAYAVQRGLPVRMELEDGKIIEIKMIRNGFPVYYITHNVDAAATIRTDDLYPGGILGLSLTGNGYTNLGVWDGGGVRTSHQEFDGRVSQEDGPVGLNDHSTHVAGTLIAAGTVAAARGMAYQANLDAYEWNDDVTEMADAAAAGMEISSHSYGFITGWYYDYDGADWHWFGNTTVDQNETYMFGYYDAEAQTWDGIAYEAPNYLIVKSAGNDRSDDGPDAGTSHSHNFEGTFTDTHYDDGYDNGGYDCISSAAVAKNILTVGAVEDLNEYDDPWDVVMSTFSGWGPADDGRIKPDVVGNGIGLYSTISTNNSSYDYSDGTSMSTPSVAGTLVLLQQHYQNLNSGTIMRSATLKALTIHTADEAGSSTGPDYKFGWGLVNAKTAAQVITEDTTQNVIDEITLDNDNTYTRDITVNGAPLKVTIVWTDPEATPVAISLDPTDLMLVNDLDLRITTGGSTYYPWSLDPSNPSDAATNSSANAVDNVEQVYIANPSSGTYTIEVGHTGSLSSGSQDFSIIVSGIDEYSDPPIACSSDLITPDDGTTGVELSTTVEWEPAIGAASYDVYFGTNGGGVTTPTNIEDSTNVTSNMYHPDLDASMTYYIQVIPRNSNGAASGCTTIWSFSTGSFSKVTSFPYSENFDGFSAIGSGNDWSDETSDDFDWDVRSGYTPTGENPSYDTGPSSDHTTGIGNYLYTESSSPNYPYKVAELLTPVFDLSALDNPTMEFWYHMFGSGTGELYIDVYGNGTWNNSVFSKSGQQSTSYTDWKLKVINLVPFSGGTAHQIRFRGITSIDWLSDMAIDDFSIQDEAYYVFAAGETDPHTFGGTGVTVEFTAANSNTLNLTFEKYYGDPGIVMPLPENVDNVSRDFYWTATLNSGTVDGTYTITLDLDGMTGIGDYSTLYLLKRPNSSNAWVIEGTNAYAGSGTEVAWTGITSGFSDFAIGGSAHDNSLPVTLSAFNALSKSGNVILTWSTESEINNMGFVIDRRIKDTENWIEIANYNTDLSLKGQGSVSFRTEYEYLDQNVLGGKTYEYRIADISYNGVVCYHESIQIDMDKSDIPDTFILKGAYPNPFNPITTIQYGLPEELKVEIVVYDITGRKVKTLYKNSQMAGWHKVQWNGSNDYGTRVSTGMYIYRVEAGPHVVHKKLLLIK